MTAPTKPTNQPATRDLELTVELDASPEDVFRAVTDGTEIAKWLCPEARVTAPADGKKGSIWISFGEGMSVEHEIEIFDAPKRMRHPSGKNGETKAPLYADWSIEAREGGKTTLRLVHSGFSTSADWDGEFEAHARGWKLMLQNLRQYFARHAHEPAVHLTFMAKVDSPRGSIWNALLGKLGLSAPPKVGDQFRFTTPKGDVLTGAVDFVTDTRILALVVREYDDSLLRFTLEGKDGAPSTFVYDYVIAYGGDRERASELRGRQQRDGEPRCPMTRTTTGVLVLLLIAACAHEQPAPAAPATQREEMAPAAFDFVGGLALRAKQPKELARWYTQQFGLPITAEFPGGVAGGFKAGATDFNIAIVAAEGAHPGSSPGTGYFVLHVNNFDRFISDVAARGLTPFEQSSDAYGRFASFRDPEGNQVAIWGK